MNFTYRNKSDQPLVIPNVGEVAPGDTIPSQFKLENPNLEEVSSSENQQEASQPIDEKEGDK